MYIQLTTRCNMECAHCCFRCGLKGDDITRETFNKALEYVDDGVVVLGGGEPTLHKDFELLLCDTLAHDLIEDEGGITVIHNGTHRKRSLLLAKLRDSGNLNAYISTDPWHDLSMVKGDVRAAYKSHEWDVSKYGSNLPIATGRGREFMGYEEGDEGPDLKNRGCVCETFVCLPTGDVKQCGCDNAPIIGDVHNGFDTDHYGCFNDQELEDEDYED